MARPPADAAGGGAEGMAWRSEAKSIWTVMQTVLGGKRRPELSEEEEEEESRGHATWTSETVIRSLHLLQLCSRA